MTNFSMKQAHDDALRFSNRSSRNKITVSGYYHCLLNMAFRSQLHHVHAKQNVNALLFKYGFSIMVPASTFEPSQTHFISGNHL